MSTSRVVIVTGTARGIGAAIATVLAADGWSVAVSDLAVDDACSTAAALAADYGVPTAGVGVDIADSSSVRAAVARVGLVRGGRVLRDEGRCHRVQQGVGSSRSAAA